MGPVVRKDALISSFRTRQLLPARWCSTSRTSKVANSLFRPSAPMCLHSSEVVLLAAFEVVDVDVEVVDDAFVAVVVDAFNRINCRFQKQKTGHNLMKQTIKKQQHA